MTAVRLPRGVRRSGAMALSPSGRYLALVGYHFGAATHQPVAGAERETLASLWLKELRTDRWRKVAERVGHQSELSWSPADRLLWWLRQTDFNGDFGIWDSAGRQLGDWIVECENPLWSPAGKRVLYWKQSDGGGTYYVCDNADLRRTMIADVGDYPSGACFSRDGMDVYVGLWGALTEYQVRR